MSTNPALQQPESQAAILQNHLVDLDEQALTTRVLIPLFKAIGYIRVEYTNGPDEYGKDIICWRDDELGEPELTVAQVKRFRPSRRAADKESLSEIVTQLSQAVEKPLPNLDGSRYLPQIVYFITPYAIDTKILESRFEAYSALRNRRVKILDGIRLATTILQRLPQLARDLLGVDFAVSSAISAHLTNEQLLHALRLPEGRAVATFFTDIDFSLARSSTRILLTALFSPAQRRSQLTEDAWKHLKNLASVCADRFSVSILTTPVETVEAKHRKSLDQLRNWHRAMKDADAAVSAAKESESLLRKDLEEQERELAKVHPEVEELQTTVTALQRALDRLDDVTRKRLRRLRKELDKLRKPLEPFIMEYQKATEYLERKRVRQEAIALEKPTELFDIELDGSGLAQALLEERKWIERQVTDINAGSPSTNDLRIFLRKVAEIFETTESILREPIIEDILGVRPPKFVDSGETTRLSIPIHAVFDTGLNMAVLGEAGAGKTTSLQMYAHRQIERRAGTLCIFVPLARAARTPGKTSSSTELRLETFIASFLTDIGVLAPVDDLLTEMDRTRGVLLLDGIDEAIKHVPRLLRLINDFSRRHPGVQIITSSRVSGSYLDEIPFLAVTLLPFTDAQRARFVRQWFGDGGEKHERKVNAHLGKNSDVATVVRTPLLATILCVLEEHGIPLPDNETRLYESRLELLLGVYDTHKQVNRLSTSRQVLERVARRIAFRMHNDGRREEEPERIHALAWKALEGDISRSVCTKAVDELFDPCNVLVPMSHDGKWGFGHLRYQEHLVALELNSNRSIDVIPFMRQSWWRGALVLFAQMNDSLQWLVNTLVEQCLVSSVQDTLVAMIERGPRRERTQHRDLIRKSLESDVQSEVLLSLLAERDDDDYYYYS